MLGRQEPLKDLFWKQGKYPYPLNSADHNYMSEPADKPKEGPDLNSVFETIKGADATELANKFKEGAPDLYNRIFSIGFGASKGEGEKTISELNTKLESVQKEIESRDAKIKELQSNSPDLQKLEEKYQGLLSEKAQLIEQIQNETNEKLSSKDQVILNERKSTFNSQLKSALVQAGVDPDYAEVVVLKESTQKRVKWGDERLPKVYQEDTETPFPSSDGKKPYEVLALDLFKKVPAKFVDDKKPEDPEFNLSSANLEKIARMPADKKKEALKKLWSGRL